MYYCSKSSQSATWSKGILNMPDQKVSFRKMFRRRIKHGRLNCLNPDHFCWRARAFGENIFVKNDLFKMQCHKMSMWDKKV